MNKSFQNVFNSVTSPVSGRGTEVEMISTHKEASSGSPSLDASLTNLSIMMSMSQLMQILLIAMWVQERTETSGIISL